MKMQLHFLALFLTVVTVNAQTTPSPSVTPKPSAAESRNSTEVQTGAASSATKRAPVQIPRFDTPPVIDGKLTEDIWRQSTVLKDFYQTQPGDNLAPSSPTEVLLGYDAQFLYIGFHAFDDPAKVRATVAKRDNVLDDDNVRIYLDTFNDKRKAYVFVFNPLGVQQDGLITEGNSEDYSVDILMDSKGQITSDGYTVEVAIPFKSIRYAAGNDTRWGLHVFRRTKHLNNEQSSWMPIRRDISSFLGQQGYITGLSDIASERVIELIPSLTIAETGSRVRGFTPRVPPTGALIPDTGRFVNQPINLDPGLTAKLGISSSMTLDLALNPDFAQVEADETVILANQRFPIFFEEKRPFFLEGIDIFQTQLNAVNTRTIIDPDVAVKISGKRGRTTYGVLVASDNAPGNFSEEERNDPVSGPGIRKFLDKNASIGVVRLKRDVGKENTIGFLATTYNFVENHNHLGGVDGRFRLSPQTIFSFQVLGTTTRSFFRDADLGKSIYRRGNGLAYSYIYDHVGRHFGYNAGGAGRTSDYRANVGFTRRTNTNSSTFLVYYNSEPQPKSRIVSWRIHNYNEFSFDWQGRSQFFQNSTALRLNLQRQTYLGVGFQKGYERVFEEEFGPKRTATRPGTFTGDSSERSANRHTFYVLGGTVPSKKYSASFEVNYTLGAFDFDFGNGFRFPRVSPAALLNPDAPFDPGPGRELFITSEISYQPTDALRVSLEYTKDRLRRYDTGRLAFDDNIFALRSTYQFTRFTFLRARVDYDTLAANMRGQFLLGWTPSPGTSFYVGYNNNLNRNGLNPFSNQLEPGFRRNAQTFFIKMSYLFRRSF